MLTTLELIRSAVSLDATEHRCARLRTSSATTAKPFPCSPALAASTAAFNAKRFVWNAISSIDLIMESTLSFPALRSFIVVCNVSNASFPFSAEIFAFTATWFASFALSAFLVVMDAISSIEADVSSIEDACCEAPSANDWLEEVISIAAEDNSFEPFNKLIVNLLSNDTTFREMKKTTAPITSTQITFPMILK